MEVVVGGDQSADRGDGTISRCLSWIPGGLGNGDRLPIRQVASSDDRN